MPRHAGWAGEPSDIFRVTAPRHDSDLSAFVGLPRDWQRARHRALDRYRDRAERKNDEVARYGEIMNQSGEWPLDHLRSNEIAGCVRGVELEIDGDTPGREVREEQHLTRIGIDLRMRRHVARQLLVERPSTDRRQRNRVHLDRSFSSSERPHLVPMP